MERVRFRRRVVGPIFFALGLVACQPPEAVGTRGIDPLKNAPTVASVPTTGMSVDPATLFECPSGGVALTVFLDANSNGRLEGEETVVSRSPVCHGTTGASGRDGLSAGIEAVPSLLAACPAGGIVVRAFIDTDRNGVRSASEEITSESTVCNGIDGRAGISAHILAIAATPAQCPAGGVVYRTWMEGEVPEDAVICNGLIGVTGATGADGRAAAFQLGAVGPAVPGKSYSACHHDYVYLPGDPASSRGWLLFRHQGNGSADQGIGQTGFQVWNVDIAEFDLVSEVGNVTYCRLHWDPIAKTLRFTVVDPRDGLQGVAGMLTFE